MKLSTLDTDSSSSHRPHVRIGAHKRAAKPCTVADWHPGRRSRSGYVLPSGFCWVYRIGRPPYSNVTVSFGGSPPATFANSSSESSLFLTPAAEMISWFFSIGLSFAMVVSPGLSFGSRFSVVARSPSRLLTFYMRNLNEQLARRAENSFE